MKLTEWQATEKARNAIRREMRKEIKVTRAKDKASRDKWHPKSKRKASDAGLQSRNGKQSKQSQSVQRVCFV